MKHLKEYHKYNPKEIEENSKYKISSYNYYLSKEEFLSATSTLEQAYYNTIYFLDKFIKKEWGGDLFLYLREHELEIRDEQDFLSTLATGSESKEWLNTFTIEWKSESGTSNIKDELDALSFFWKEDPEYFFKIFGEPEDPTAQ